MSKKIWKIPLVILSIIASVVLLSLLQYLLYSKNHPATYHIDQRVAGTLVLEDGSEYSETIPLQLDGFYFDYGMFYTDKDYIYLDASSNGEPFYNGYYAVTCKADSLIGTVTGADGTELEHQDDYKGRLLYADFKRKEPSVFIFYIEDILRITTNGTPGQKGLLVLADPSLGTPSEIVQNAIRKRNLPENVFSEEFKIDNERFYREYKGW